MTLAFNGPGPLLAEDIIWIEFYPYRALDCGMCSDVGTSVSSVHGLCSQSFTTW